MRGVDDGQGGKFSYVSLQSRVPEKHSLRSVRQLVDAWTSHKSFHSKDGEDDDNSDGSGRDAGRNFHGERRSNDSHAATTHPEPRMYRNSFAHPARLCYTGHASMENRNALVVDA
jgi:hypothetical protein